MRHLAAVLLAAMAMCGTARAATGLVQISSVSDFTLGSWGIGNPAVSATVNVCVYADTLPAGTYAVTITSPNGFVLSSGSNTIPYSLYWNDPGAGNLGSGAGTQTANGVKLTGQANAALVLPPLCLGSGPNAQLTLKIAQADMTAALAGTYTGTITLLIAAN